MGNLRDFFYVPTGTPITVDLHKFSSGHHFPHPSPASEA
jgi:hypothetical protein